MSAHRINPRTGCVVTPAGIEIGAAYQPPPAQMGSHAERVQSALLGGSFPRSRRVDHRIKRTAIVIETDSSLVARMLRVLQRVLR